MKYCYKCGNPMEDDMMFCQKCGAKALEVSSENATTSTYTNEPISAEQKYTQNEGKTTSPVSMKMGIQDQFQQVQTPAKTLRKSMKIWMIVCIVFAGAYMLIGPVTGETGMAVGIGGFFVVLAVMFFVLAKSPKENPFLFGRQTGLKKKVFVLIFIVAAFAIAGIGMEMGFGTASQDENASNALQSSDSQNESLSDQERDATESASNAREVTLSDIHKWYESQMPAVAQALPEYAQSVDGMSNLNVNESRFFFGGDWNDCYYKFLFTCKVDGVNHNGEARAFLKYQEDDIHWFSFEIFGNDSLQSVVELYDASYDQIIEDYYKELESLYA